MRYLVEIMLVSGLFVRIESEKVIETELTSGKRKEAGGLIVRTEQYLRLKWKDDEGEGRLWVFPMSDVSEWAAFTTEGTIQV